MVLGSGHGKDDFQRADDRFVVACGQRELWSRIRREINRESDCAWNKFGPETGKPTLADCMAVFLSARECYGASYNQLVLEFVNSGVCPDDLQIQHWLGRLDFKPGNRRAVAAPPV
jgi:hypothetical protein